jgi:hypothetical protein
LGRTPDGAVRGWMASLYIQFTGITINGLAYSDELITTAAPPPSSAQASGASAPAVPAVDLDEFLDRHLSPAVINSAYRLFYTGQTYGHDPHSFIVIGDSTSAGNQYTLPMFWAFAHGTYTLGPYSYLQTTISFFRESFGASYLTSHPGYTTYSVLDPGLSNPNICEVGESPLECEIRTKQPSVAIIYIGFGDLAFSTVDAYGAYLDMILQILTHHGVIPVLTTLTASVWTLEASRYMPRFTQMNNIVRAYAGKYQVPLIDLHQAAAGLPNQGCIEEGTHLSYRVDGTIRFTGDERIYGKDLRELLTLLVLDDLRRNVLSG